MTRSAILALLLTGGLHPPLGAADAPVNLTEKVAPGDRAKFTAELDLKGDLIFDVEGKQASARLGARARHIFTERVLAVADGMPAASARFYAEAAAVASVGGEKSDRSLPADRRLIVARRNPDGLFCFAPAGPLTRDELDLVTEHFNPQCLAGLLPGKAVNVGDTWTVSPVAVHTACLFDALVKSQLVGKLTAVKDGTATFTVEGTAEGTENGARVVLTVTATGTFDISTGRVTALVWKQKDEREQGPVSPASRVEATVTLKREAVAELPRELADDAIAKLPAGEPPASLTDLRLTDPRGQYALVYHRGWHVTGQSDTHLVLRLMERDTFLAQATVSLWRKLEPGKHSPADEFKKAIAGTRGWTQTKVLEEGEIPVASGWLYRLTAEGTVDSMPVVQTFYLLAGPRGDQVAVTVVMRPEQAKAVGTRDLELVKAIDFGKGR